MRTPARTTIGRLLGLVALAGVTVGVLAVAGRAAAATSPGQLYAFGLNQDGELGNEVNVGHLVANPTPALVTLPGESGPVAQVAAGAQFSLAVTSSGQLYGFGEDGWGQLGYNPMHEGAPPEDRPTAMTLPGATGGVVQAAGGWGHTLAVTSSGQLYALGRNKYGELGVDTNSGTGDGNATPMLVSLPGATGQVVRTAAGAQFSLALTSTGQLYSFGDNDEGQLGSAMGDWEDDRSSIANPTPRVVALPGATGPVTQIAAGGDFSLAVTSTGQLFAFGENYGGQLANTLNLRIFLLAANPTPTLVTLPAEVGPVIQVAAGGQFSLALTSTGQLYAFGENYFGQLGNANNLTGPNPMPALVRMPAGSGHIVRIAAGGEDSLALTSTGKLYIFGGNLDGELGIPPDEHPIDEKEEHSTPILVALPGGATVETMATGCCSSHTLLVTADLALSTSTLPKGETGRPYAAQPQATGGAPPYRWSATGLAPGLSIDPTTGAMSGTPTTGGKYSPRVTVTDSYGIEASLALPITIQPLPAPPSETAPMAALAGARPTQAPSTPARGQGGGRVSRPGSGPAGIGGSRLRKPARGAARPADSRAGPSAIQASAWTVHAYLGQITHAGAEMLDKPAGLAVDSSGRLYVTDADTERHGYLYRYSATNELECQVAGGFPEGEVESVAVNDENGDVYVAEDGLFTPSVWLLKPGGGCYKTPVGTGYYFHLESLAFDNGPGPHHGDLYATALSVPYVIKLNAEGELTELGTELPEPVDNFAGFNTGIAVDPTGGNIYLSNSSNGELDVYNLEDELEPQTLTASEQPRRPEYETFEPNAVAVDPSTGEVYAVDTEHKVVDEFASNGELIGQITGLHTPAGEFVKPRGVAVKPSTHEVYVADEGAHAIDIFGPDEEGQLAPKPTTEAASEIGTSKATLNGSVERKEGEPLSWFFRYAPGSSCTGAKRTERKALAAGATGLLHEHATLEGLEPSTQYSVCFGDEGPEGVPGIGSVESFETPPLAPTGGAVSAGQITPTSAVLEGSVNPQNQATKYRFEYATNANFEEAIVGAEASFAKGIYPAQPVVSPVIANLAPGTTYYVRLVAENATGKYTSPSASFKTLPAASSAVSFWNASEGETVADERLEAYVNPGYQSTNCAFEYTPEAEHQLHGFTGAVAIPCAPSPFGSPTSPFAEAVSAAVTGLQLGVTYDYEVVAQNAAGTSEGPIPPATATFTTWGPPNPTTGGAEVLGRSSATLTGAVNPDHLVTTYHFEYATEAAYTQAEQEAKPDPYVGGHSTAEGNAGSGASRQTLPATPISGLQAGTLYHYRLVATNEAGTRYGQDETFATEAERAITSSSTASTTTATESTSVTTTSTTSSTRPHKGRRHKQSTRLTNAQQLKRALEMCHKRSRRARVKCERQARGRYGHGHRRARRGS